jgi:hypothetical protein
VESAFVIQWVPSTKGLQVRPRSNALFKLLKSFEFYSD